MAAKSPGGKEVARISVRVVPDTSDFPSLLKAQLEKIEKQLKIKIPIILDEERVKEELKKIQEQAKKTKAKIQADLDENDVVKKTRRLKALAQKLTGAIKFTVGINTAESLSKMKAQLAIIKKFVKGYNISIPVDLVGWAKLLAIAGLISAAFLTTQNILGGVGGAVQAIGGSLALIPALAAGAAASIAVLATGLHGMADALSNAGDPAKFEESLKKLAPAAQDAARQLATFREPLHDIRMATQQSLFSGMAFDIGTLKRLLPPIKDGFVEIAGGIRDMGKEWIDMATRQKSINDLRTILHNTAGGFKEAKPAMANFGQALRDLAAVGSSFLPRLGKAIAKMSGNFRDFIANARENGDLEKWINNAIETFKQLGRIIANVWGIFSDIRQAMAGPGGGFLDIIERATKSLREMTSSDKGQQFFKNLARVMREVLDVATQVFKELFSSIGDVLKDAMPFILQFTHALGGALITAIKILTPMLQSLARFLSDNKEIMAPLAVAILSVVTAFKLMVTAAKGVMTVVNSLKVLKAAASAVKIAMVGANGSGGIIAAVKFIGTGMGKGAAAVVRGSVKFITAFKNIAVAAVENATRVTAVWISQAAKSAAFTARYFIKMAATAIANFVRITVAATANALKTAGIWIAQGALMVARAIAQAAAMAAAWVAQWIRMAAVATANAIRMAAAWFIAMGPVGWVIGIIVALVAIIVLNWDKIWAVTKSIFSNIWQFLVNIFTTVKNFIGNFIGGIVDWFSVFPHSVFTALGNLGGTLLGKGRDLLNGLWNGIKNVAAAVWNWFKNLPSVIGHFFADVGSWLYNAGRDLIQGLINGVTDMISNAIDAVLGVSKAMTNNMKVDLGVHSPSTVFHEIGMWTIRGLANGIKDTSSEAEKASSQVGTDMSAAFTTAFSIGDGLQQGIKDATPGAVQSMQAMIKRVNTNADATWKGTMETDFDSVADKVAGAIEGWTVELDRNGMAKMVRKQNTADARRR